MYRLDITGLAELRAWTDTFWDAVLDSYAERVRADAASRAPDRPQAESAQPGSPQPSRRNQARHHRRRDDPVPDEPRIPEPVKKTVTVPAPPERAFELFTAARLGYDSGWDSVIARYAELAALSGLPG